MSLREYDKAETLRYILVGVLTSGVNLSVYFLCNKLLQVNYLASNLIAWVCTVLVAYAANKLFVFHSHTEGLRALAREFVLFVNSRLFSGAVDQLLMWILVGGCGFNSSIVKFVNSGVVVALNYVISRLLVFGQPRREES